jgi:hypothetical protein
LPSAERANYQTCGTCSCAIEVLIQGRTLVVDHLVMIDKRPNRSSSTGKINSWKTILNALTIHYGRRIATTN